MWNLYPHVTWEGLSSSHLNQPSPDCRMKALSVSFGEWHTLWAHSYHHNTWVAGQLSSWVSDGVQSNSLESSPPQIGHSCLVTPVIIGHSAFCLPCAAGKNFSLKAGCWFLWKLIQSLTHSRFSRDFSKVNWTSSLLLSIIFFNFFLRQSLTL